MRPGEINWDNLRTEYVTTGISLRNLANEHSISIRRIADISKEQEWVRLRKEYRNATATEAQQKTHDKDVDDMTNLLESTRTVYHRAMEALSDKQQFNRYIVYESPLPGTSEAKEKICEKVDTKAMKELVSVIKECTSLMREFLGIPTPAQAEAQRIAAERLALEQKRADADQVDKDIHVVIGGDAEDYSV